MKKIISFKLASQISLIIIGLFMLFHFTIIMGILIFDFAPLAFLWGGRMQSAEELLDFEIISLAVMTICLLLVLLKTNKIRLPKLKLLTTISLWIFTLLFLLNTLGNIVALTTFENSLSLVTASLACLFARLALEK